ncbi:ubiquitin carboxyl-terminal hydrolase 8-like [Hydractinia symbiolongicarpus]|uniref:ubiquitin carboxyl-terminal hydrolase 8-like n=1 Tax=Hydractinia symbiolongicarpus TaxID=13093 RepID=UPI00254F51AB|nr:ubiquitin carboxyl-terminal hydrolase 8-like [Hydractinia symbiolongicarpus]
MKHHVSAAKGSAFIIFAQHDVPEVLEYLLPGLSLDFPFLGSLFSIGIMTSTTCNSCHITISSELIAPCIQLSLHPTLQSSLDNFFKSEELSDTNAYFCHVCNAHQTPLVKKEVVSCGSHLILQLKRFASANGLVSKIASRITAYPGTLSIPFTVNGEVKFRKNFQLRAFINHCGNLNDGHYTTIAFDQMVHRWIHCNDRAVIFCNDRLFNSDESYVFFLEELR